ncbi:MAG: chloride channel protein [Deltaproteobacteria bacterium]|nr:chloride channel protein [Deltaproteobacteria bacterium]
MRWPRDVLPAIRRALVPGASRRLVAQAIGVGFFSGLAAALLIWLINIMNRLFGIDGADANPAPWIFLVPAIGGLIVGPLVTWLAPETRGHGVPEVMLAVAQRGGDIRPRVAILKTLASAITIGSGGSAGREGPIVQIGAALGSTVAHLTREPVDLRRTLVACGAASGIAASFNAPIAGVIFALEVILRDFAGRAFAMVVMSSVTASVVARSLVGSASFFRIPPYHLGHGVEIVFYALLGMIAAVVARLFILALYFTEDMVDRTPLPTWLKPAAGGLAVGMLGFLLPEILGVGHFTMEQALAGQLSGIALAVLLIGKIVATSLTLGSGGSGGVFAPSLFMGAMLGGAFARAVGLIAPGIGLSPGAFAVVGMGALFTGASFAPMTSILIIIEMTHDYDLILPLMAACGTAMLVSYWVSPESIYTLKLSRRGIALRQKAEPMEAVRVEQVMTAPPDLVAQTTPFSQLVEFIRNSPHSGFPVVDADGALVGLITSEEMHQAFAAGDNVPAAIAADLMRRFPPVVGLDETLATAVRLMRHHGVDRIPVVDAGDRRRVIGVVSQSDVIQAVGIEIGCPAETADVPKEGTPSD